MVLDTGPGKTHYHLTEIAVSSHQPHQKLKAVPEAAFRLRQNLVAQE